jgi:hypothetical protein
LSAESRLSDQERLGRLAKMQLTSNFPEVNEVP